MTYLYTFKATLNNISKPFYRTIKISANMPMTRLAYTVLASFDAKASHLFNMNYKGKRYEIVYEEDDLAALLGPAIDPTTVKLSQLGLRAGDKISLDYDYGAGWNWTIEFLSVEEMEPGTARKYPCVVDGFGRGIIEDSFSGEIEEIIERTDKTGEMPIEYQINNKDYYWDYREFDIEYMNNILKNLVNKYKKAYEI